MYGICRCDRRGKRDYNQPWKEILQMSGVRIGLCSLVWLLLCCLILFMAPVHTRFEWECGPLGDFSLKTITGRMVDASSWETDKQTALCRWLDPSDSILQLGGNIGASCTIADRIVKRESGRVACVEPYKEIANVLAENKKANDANFGIIHGMITPGGAKNCKFAVNGCAKQKEAFAMRYKTPPANEEEEAERAAAQEKTDAACSRATITPVESGTEAIDKDAQVQCHSLQDVVNTHLNGRVSVLFADCEGCLPYVINHQDDFFLNHTENLRLVIFHDDHWNNPGDGERMKQYLQAWDFRPMQTRPVQVWCHNRFNRKKDCKIKTEWRFKHEISGGQNE